MTKGKSLLCLAALAGGIISASAGNIILTTPPNYQVLSISPNAKWAAGVFVDATMNTYGFRWNLESGALETLGAGTSTGFDVSNDGTVSGDFSDKTVSANGVGISMPGFWRDGKWHSVEKPDGAISDGVGYGISPDGQYLAGSICKDGLYLPYIWKNGELYRTLSATNHAMPYAVSPDGNMATGYYTQYNRTSVVWPEKGNPIMLEDSQMPQHPFCAGHNFSPDGTKMVYWGGWEVVEGQGDDDGVYLWCYYDTTTGERHRVKTSIEHSELELFDISNSGIMVGYDSGRGFIQTLDKGMFIDDYLKERGVDLSSFDNFYSGTEGYIGTLPICRVVGISEDENSLAMVYYDKDGQIASMVLKMDQDISKLPPVEVKAEQLSALSTVGLTWKRPVGATSIRGYNVYRDGVKLNGILPLNALSYYDKNLASGTYSYEVSAVTTSGVETRAEAVEVTVNPMTPEQPYQLFSRRKGVSGAYFSWNAPMAEIAHKRYYNAESNELSGFTIYQPVDVELAVRFPHTDLANYDGYKVSEVSFWPMGDHKNWTINIYSIGSDGTPQLVASQPVTQNLTLDKLNTIKLDQPVAIPNTDVIVAVETTVDPSFENVIGSEAGPCMAGYTDLLRLKEEPNFYSAYNSSIEAGALYLSCLTWVIDLGLESPDFDAEKAGVDHYNVYVDDDLMDATTACVYEFQALEEGKYQLGVEAVYKSGAVSHRAVKETVIEPKYPKVTDVKVATAQAGSPTVKATWSAPKDYDLTDVSYTDATVADHGFTGVEAFGYTIAAASIYQPSMLRGYEGYRIKSLRFYPMTDAIYTLMLYADNALVCEIEVDEFTPGHWNEVELPDEVYVKAGASYRLVADAFDPIPEVPVFAMDGNVGRDYESDLYSVDNGETWKSVGAETSRKGNWMMGMRLVDNEPLDLDVDGYDVLVDGRTVNDARVEATEYEHSFSKVDDKEHRISVAAYYQGVAERVIGEATYFTLATSGIDDVTVATLTLSQGANYLEASGENVTGMALYDTAGMLVASAEGARLEISAVQPGVYIATINVDGKKVNRKIQIK